MIEIRLEAGIETRNYLLVHCKIKNGRKILRHQNEEVPLEEGIQREGYLLITKEKETELIQEWIHLIQILGNFILTRVARIAFQLRVS